MGSMIHLSVGRLEIDWGKNAGFTDHSPLYQVTDVTKVPYYYVDEDNPQKEGGGPYDYNLKAEYKFGLSKPLREVIDRINLLGHTREYSRHEFEAMAELNFFDQKQFSFEQLAEALATVDVNAISADYGDGEDFGKFFRRYMFERLGLEEIVDDPDYVRLNAGEAMENLSAYTILQLLSANPSAQDLPVNWQFADVEYGGWAGRDHFVRQLDASNRFLVVTEGSSDVAIIRHALQLLAPTSPTFSRSWIWMRVTRSAARATCIISRGASSASPCRTTSSSSMITMPKASPATTRPRSSTFPGPCVC